MNRLVIHPWYYFLGETDAANRDGQSLQGPTKQEQNCQDMTNAASHTAKVVAKR